SAKPDRIALVSICTFRASSSLHRDPLLRQVPYREAAAMAKMITLKSSDGEVFEVDEAVAMESQTIKHMIEDDCAENGIPLPNVTSKILAKVIEYCRKHVDASAAAASKSSDDSSKLADEELKSWDAEFVKVDQATLFDLILAVSLLSFTPYLVSAIYTLCIVFLALMIWWCMQAANYLNIKGLLDLTCQTVADMIKGKTPEEIRKTFNIKNDFTPEEEEEVRRENQWAFE
ncbi:unnamed protein product, partial [Musa hybrid cultivar]